MMLTRYVEKALQRIPGLDQSGLQLSRSIHEAVLQGGEPTRQIADLLHGKWLGHPLHPVLTDFTIGAWALGTVFDVIAAKGGGRYAERAADTLTAIGTATAVPTLLTGLADYSTVQKPAVSTATLHALLNDVNFVLYLLSLRERRNGNRRRGIFYSTLALGLLAASAWLGGHLVYGHKVGVDHRPDEPEPESWTPALAASDLPEREPRRVEVAGYPVLLYRCDGAIHAIGAVCSHAGGPLEEGRFDGCYVQCPWHDSVFDLRDGSIKHGPATHPQSSFAVRVQDGQVEIRSR